MNYTSSIKIAGLPLLSVVLENKRISEAKPAVGVIAIGQYAFGIVTISQFGVGVVSISQFGVAVLSISQFAVNLIAGHGQNVVNLGQYLGL